MDRKKYSIIVIMYTIFNIGVLVGAGDYLEQTYKSQYNNRQQVSKIKEDNQGSAQGNENKNQDLAQNNAENENLMSQGKYKNSNNNNNYSFESDNNVQKATTNYTYNNESTSRTNTSAQNTKVFKAYADEIISDLSFTEKAKLLWVCRKLSKEEYNQIEDYLSYNNEKLGVMKVYAILEKNLDDESLEEVKDIFSKYIYTEKIKEIY